MLRTIIATAALSTALLAAPSHGQAPRTIPVDSTVHQLPVLQVDAVKPRSYSASTLAHRNIAHEITGTDSRFSSALMDGASSMIYKDIPVFGTLFFIRGEQVLINPQENHTIESTFPSYHMQLRPIRTNALRPASDFGVALEPVVEPGVQGSMHPFRSEVAVGHRGEEAQIGLSYSQRYVPAFLESIVAEFATLGSGPRVHGVGILGSEQGNHVSLEAFSSNLATDYTGLLGFDSYEEKHKQQYSVLHLQQLIGSNAKLEFTGFVQQGEVRTDAMQYGEQENHRQYVLYRGVTAALSIEGVRGALRVYDLEHENSTRRTYTVGQQFDIETATLIGANTGLKASSRLDVLRGEAHPSIEATLSQQIGAVTVEVGAAALWDPLSPSRLGESLVELAHDGDEYVQRTQQLHLAAEATFGHHTLRAEVQPRSVELPYLEEDARISGVTARLTNTYTNGLYTFSATAAIRELDLRMDKETTPVPGTAQRELKAVINRAGESFSAGLSLAARQGVHFPIRGGKTVDLGDQYVANISASYTYKHLTISSSLVNVSKWLGHNNSVGAVHSGGTTEYLQMPSWPNVSLHWKL